MMMNASVPLVSIVIPVYNQHIQYLSEAITSALTQTYSSIELIVSDNYSTNDVPAYLNTLKDERLRIVKPPTFLPMVQHFQFAADQARGEYVTFLCSDDWLYPDFLSECIPQLVAHESVVIAYGEIECVDHRNLNSIKFYYNRRQTGLRSAAESLNEILRSRPFIAWMPGGIMRLSAYQQIRDILSGEFTYAFDLAMLFKLHECGNVLYIDKPLGKFRFWTVKDGKVANDRFLEFIGDTGKLCALIERSPMLVSYLANGLSDMQLWRQYQAQRWLLGLLVGYINGDVESEKCIAGIQAVAEHVSPKTSFSYALHWAVRKPQSLLIRPSLRSMHAIYSYLQSKIKVPF